MVYSTRRFVVCLSVCHFVLVFFSPFSIAITSLGEEKANLSAFSTVCACFDLSVSSSSWGLGRAAVCDCGTPWTFLLLFFLELRICNEVYVMNSITIYNNNNNNKTNFSLHLQAPGREKKRNSNLKQEYSMSEWYYGLSNRRSWAPSYLAKSGRAIRIKLQCPLSKTHWDYLTVWILHSYQGPVVQSIVSLTSSLVVKMLTSSKYNI